MNLEDIQLEFDRLTELYHKGAIGYEDFQERCGFLDMLSRNYYTEVAR